MYKNFVSLQHIVDRVLTHPLMEGITFEKAITDAVTCLKLINSIAIQEDKVERVTIEEYRGIVPIDILRVNQARIVLVGEDDKETYYPINTSTYSFSIANGKSDTTEQDNVNNTYYINGEYMITSFETGVVDINYKGLYLDTNGLPLIPDDAAVIKAVENYIKKEWFSILADLDKIKESTYAKAAQEYAWYVGKAQTTSKLTSIDDRETLSNVINKLYIDTSNYSSFHRNTGTREYIRNK